MKRNESILAGMKTSERQVLSVLQTSPAAQKLKAVQQRFAGVVDSKYPSWHAAREKRATARIRELEQQRREAEERRRAAQEIFEKEKALRDLLAQRKRELSMTQVQERSEMLNRQLQRTLHAQEEAESERLIQEAELRGHSEAIRAHLSTLRATPGQSSLTPDQILKILQDAGVPVAEIPSLAAAGSDAARPAPSRAAEPPAPPSQSQSQPGPGGAGGGGGSESASMKTAAGASKSASGEAAATGASTVAAAASSGKVTFTATYEFETVPQGAELDDRLEVIETSGGVQMARIPRAWTLEIKLSDGTSESLHVARNTLLSEVRDVVARKYHCSDAAILLLADGVAINGSGTGESAAAFADLTVEGARLFGKVVTATVVPAMASPVKRLERNESVRTVGEASSTTEVRPLAPEQPPLRDVGGKVAVEPVERPRVARPETAPGPPGAASPAPTYEAHAIAGPPGQSPESYEPGTDQASGEALPPSNGSGATAAVRTAASGSGAASVATAPADLSRPETAPPASPHHGAATRSGRPSLTADAPSKAPAFNPPPRAPAFDALPKVEAPPPAKIERNASDLSEATDLEATDLGESADPAVGRAAGEHLSTPGRGFLGAAGASSEFTPRGTTAPERLSSSVASNKSKGSTGRKTKRSGMVLGGLSGPLGGMGGLSLGSRVGRMKFDDDEFGDDDDDGDSYGEGSAFGTGGGFGFARTGQSSRPPTAPASMSATGGTAGSDAVAASEGDSEDEFDF